MEPIQTTNNLIQFAESDLPKEYVSVRRAFHTGTVENLGAFEHVYGSRGWILKIISKHNSVYYVAIMVYYFGYRTALINEPPWKYWEGDKSDNKLYQGDNPLLYKELRDGETKRLDKNTGRTCPDS